MAWVIDDKLKMAINGNAKYFLQNHLGSTTTGLTNPTGAITEFHHQILLKRCSTSAVLLEIDT